MVLMSFLVRSLLLALCCPASAMALQAHANITTPFQSAYAANKACVTCHAQEDADLRKSVHWTWQRDGVVNGQAGLLDKKTSLARFGLVAAANPEPCLTCHLNIMPDVPGDNIDRQGTVNCLVCHDTTGRYRAGISTAELLPVVQNAGNPAPRNCQTCHDRDCHLTPEGTGPDTTADIHVRKLGFSCQKCHPGLGRHALAREMPAPDGEKSHAGCMACHGQRPHQLVRLNQHGRFVGCQSCHIPVLAGDTPVMLSWNWLAASTTEILRRVDGSPAIKGGFLTGRNIRPSYFWDDGSHKTYDRGSRIQGQHVTLDQPGPRSPRSKIMPFRTILATQFKDRKYHYLLSPTLNGQQPPFWSPGMLQQAFATGMTALRLPFSGEKEPVITVQFRRMNHGVVRARDTLTCMDCHGTGNGFNWQQLGYREDPWQDLVQHPPEMLPPPPTLSQPPVEESVLPAMPEQ